MLFLLRIWMSVSTITFMVCSCFFYSSFLFFGMGARGSIPYFLIAWVSGLCVVLAYHSYAVAESRDGKWHSGGFQLIQASLYVGMAWVVLTCLHLLWALAIAALSDGPSPSVGNSFFLLMSSAVLFAPLGRLSAPVNFTLQMHKTRMAHGTGGSRIEPRVDPGLYPRPVNTALARSAWLASPSIPRVVAAGAGLAALPLVSNHASFTDTDDPFMSMPRLRPIGGVDSMGAADSIGSLHDMEINPANGLPMMGMLDVAGNPFGTDMHNSISEHHDYSNLSSSDSLSNHDAFAASDPFRDSFSTGTSFSDSFDSIGGRFDD